MLFIAKNWDHCSLAENIHPVITNWNIIRHKQIGGGGGGNVNFIKADYQLLKHYFCTIAILVVCWYTLSWSLCVMFIVLNVAMFFSTLCYNSFKSSERMLSLFIILKIVVGRRRGLFPPVHGFVWSCVRFKHA